MEFLGTGFLSSLWRDCTRHPTYLNHIKRLNVFNQYCSKKTEEPHTKHRRHYPQCCHQSHDTTSKTETDGLHVPKDNQKGWAAECAQAVRKKSSVNDDPQTQRGSHWGVGCKWWRQRRLFWGLQEKYWFRYIVTFKITGTSLNIWEANWKN